MAHAQGAGGRRGLTPMVDHARDNRVSVIMVVRNGARHIREALDSVYRSTIKPLEVVVVDGGSSDGTADIARGFPSTRVIAQNGTGIAAAYNQGVAQARGGLIAFISHDDIWTQAKLDIQVGYMVAHPDCLISAGHIEHFLDSGADVPAGFRGELLERPHPGWVMEALMARPEVFRRVGPFNPEFAISEDTDWFARARDLAVESAMLPDVLLRKRVHTTNASLNEKRINQLLLRAMRNSIERKRQTP